MDRQYARLDLRPVPAAVIGAASTWKADAKGSTGASALPGTSIRPAGSGAASAAWAAAANRSAIASRSAHQGHECESRKASCSGVSVCRAETRQSSEEEARSERAAVHQYLQRVVRLDALVC